MASSGPHHEEHPSIPVHEAEISLQVALKALLTDEELADLKLVGSDGETVFCNRGLLSARSPVFRRMLFGDFEEATKTVVSVGCTGNVLRAVVEYCYTDAVEVLGNKEDCDDSKARTLASLADAANYFGLTELRRKTQACARTLMLNKPHLACVFLNEERAAGGAAGMEAFALKVIRTKPSAALLEGSSALSMDSSVLEIILKDNKVKTDELTMFLALKRWAEARSNCPEGPVVGVGNEDRHDIAAQLTKHIRFRDIDPLEIKNTVASTGLVTRDQLFAIYETQALEAQTIHGVSRKKPRFVRPVWQSSTSDVFTSFRSCDFETLSCAVMRSGVHKWSIRIRSLVSWICLGVVSTGHRIDDVLGTQRGSWAYRFDGSAYYACANTRTVDAGGHPTFHEGSVVTFTLDLAGQENGTLSAAVDDGAAVQLFSNMLSEFDETQTVGLVPAVSFGGPGGSVRFLGFDSTD